MSLISLDEVYGLAIWFGKSERGRMSGSVMEDKNLDALVMEVLEEAAMGRTAHDQLGKPVIPRFPVKPRQRDLRDPPDAVECRPGLFPAPGLGELGV